MDLVWRQVVIWVADAARIQCCHDWGVGHSCSSNSIPGPETSIHCRCGRKKKKKKNNWNNELNAVKIVKALLAVRREKRIYYTWYSLVIILGEFSNWLNLKQWGVVSQRLLWDFQARRAVSMIPFIGIVETMRKRKWPTQLEDVEEWMRHPCGWTSRKVITGAWEN